VRLSNADVLAYFELEVETNLGSDRQPIRHGNAGKDRAFDNYWAQLYRHNQSSDWTKSITVGCSGEENATIIDEGRCTTENVVVSVASVTALTQFPAHSIDLVDLVH